MNRFVIRGNRNDDDRMHEAACALTHKCSHEFLVIIYNYHYNRDFWIKKGVSDLYCHYYINKEEIPVPKDKNKVKISAKQVKFGLEHQRNYSITHNKNPFLYLPSPDNYTQ